MSGNENDLRKRNRKTLQNCGCNARIPVVRYLQRGRGRCCQERSLQAGLWPKTCLAMYTYDEEVWGGLA